MSVTFSQQSAEIKHLRAASLLEMGNAWTYVEVLRRVDRAFDAFFRRVKAGDKPGYPRFRSRRRYNSLTWQMEGGKGGGCHIRGVRLELQGVGHVKVRWHRALPAGASIKTAEVKRRASGWYVYFSLDGVAVRPLPATGRAVGVDLGISTFAALSTGELIAGPRAHRAASTAVRRAARKVTRRERGSNRRRKAAALLARQRGREANRRRDHAHKTARMLVERFDLIAIEALNVRGLAAGILARDCNDQGWGQFVTLLHEKAEEAAREVVLVDARNTSQACSACGQIVPKALGVRVHQCTCGYTADRDVNAARNVLAKAIGPDGAVRRERWGEEARAVA